MSTASLQAIESAPRSRSAGEWTDHPSGFLALSQRNQRFSLPSCEGFISYREQGHHLFLFGGVHAPVMNREHLLDEFIRMAEKKRRQLVSVQVRLSQAELFRSRGFTLNQLGTSYGLRLQNYSLAGKARMKLRNKIRRAQALDISIHEVGHELVRGPATFSLLQEVSERWLCGKAKKELDFMIGELGGPDQPQRRIFVAIQGRGTAARWLGFITYVPVHGEQSGYLHDLTRRLPDAPPGTMELCNSVAMERLRADGATYLHFGFTPFVTSGEEPQGANRLLAWLIRKLARYGQFIYPAQTQVDYKMKWGPDLIEPELVAVRPLSIRAIWDLLILTRSI